MAGQGHYCSANNIGGEGVGLICQLGRCMLLELLIVPHCMPAGLAWLAGTSVAK